MSAKRKKKLKEREARRNRIRRLSQDETSTTELNIQKEADYIVSRAAERDARCIVVGILVFFSTATGDAWMLDLEDRFALGLARDGVRSPARILEIEGRMAVEWTHFFEIDGDQFTTIDRKTGRITTITGYPMDAIVATIERAQDAR